MSHNYSNGSSRARVKGESLIDKLAENGGEICFTREGKTVAELVGVDAVPSTDTPPVEGLVLYKGEWMIPAAAERERSIEHLRGSGKVIGDIVSPIDDGVGRVEAIVVPILSDDVLWLLGLRIKSMMER